MVSGTADMGVKNEIMNNLNHMDRLFCKISFAILYGLKTYYPEAYSKIIIYLHEVYLSSYQR